MEIPLFIEQLLTRYESGRTTRRALIGALAGGAAIADRALGSEQPSFPGSRWSEGGQTI